MIRALGPSFFKASTSGTVGFVETWPGANHAALPSPWVTISGAFEQNGANKCICTSPGNAIRNANGGDYTLTNDVNTSAGCYVGLIVRADSSVSNFIAVAFHSGSGKLRYYEHLAGVDSNIIDGPTSWSDNTTYTVATVLSGTSVIVKLNGVAEITTTCQAGFTSLTYVGLTQAITAPAFGSWATMTVA